MVRAPSMPLALSTPAQIATLAAIFAILIAVRIAGRWLIGKGSAIERAKHGVLPGVGSAPARPRTPAEEHPADEPEPEPYDPFNAG